VPLGELPSGVRFGLATTAELIMKEIRRKVVSNTDNHEKQLFAMSEETKEGHV